MKVKSLSHVRLLATPWTAAHQAPPSMGFSMQESWSGVPLHSPRSIYVCANGTVLLLLWPSNILLYIHVPSSLSIPLQLTRRGPFGRTRHGLPVEACAAVQGPFQPLLSEVAMILGMSVFSLTKWGQLESSPRSTVKVKSESV